MNYSETIQYLYDRLPVFHHIGANAYKPGLSNTIKLLGEMSNPHTKFKTIHIAGTNGKGSVSHYLAAILQCAGYKVGLYTSPHLVDFSERIRINGHPIGEQYVIDFVAHHKVLFEAVQPSFFEATMAMAFDYFADQEVDVAIIETGLGGRLDSTNIITPELSVITNISWDHMNFLGDTLAKIAFEKAGIIKKDIPVVIGEVLPETKSVFEEKASNEQSPIYFAEEQFTVKSVYAAGHKMKVTVNQSLCFVSGLTGEYQTKNIATVLAAVKELNKLSFDITNEALSNGLEYVTEITDLKGRWQILRNQPTTIADTAHNVAGIEYICAQLQKQTYKTLRVVIGMVNDKDVSKVLGLLPSEAVYYFCQAGIARAMEVAELADNAQKAGLQGNIYSSVRDAIECAITDSDPDDFIYIGGSNFVVGEALPLFQ